MWIEVKCSTEWNGMEWNGMEDNSFTHKYIYYLRTCASSLAEFIPVLFAFELLAVPIRPGLKCSRALKIYNTTS